MKLILLEDILLNNKIKTVINKTKDVDRITSILTNAEYIWNGALSIIS